MIQLVQRGLKKRQGSLVSCIFALGDALGDSIPGRGAVSTMRSPPATSWQSTTLKRTAGSGRPEEGQFRRASGGFRLSICETHQGVGEAGQARMRSQEMTLTDCPSN